MKHEHEMNSEQYHELTKSLNNVSQEIGKLNKSFADLDAKVTSISTWINGDPTFKSSVGTDEKISNLEEKVHKNERELENMKRIDVLEESVDEHDTDIKSLMTFAANLRLIWIVLTVLGTIVLAIAGIVIPPYLT